MLISAPHESQKSIEDDYRKLCAPELVANPLVSIVCVTYNHHLFIRDALDAFLMQETAFPFEIIVHDDVSNDGTIDILQEYATQHPGTFALILRNTNIHSRGQSATYHALKHARGKYVALCEGDDFWTDTQKLQKQVDFLENNPDFVVCYHRFYPCTKKDEIGYALPERIRNPEVNRNGQKRKPNYMTTATVMFRHVPDFLPPVIHNAKFRDNFIFAMLGNLGKGMYLDNIQPTGYRLHGGGIFSLTSDAQKKIDRIITFFWIANAFEQHSHDARTAWYWRYRAARILTGASGSATDEMKAGLHIFWYSLKTLLMRPAYATRSGIMYAWCRFTKKKRLTAIIFGASRGGRNAYMNLRHRYQVVAFTDNDTAKHGGQLLNRPIISPDTLLQQHFDLILVSSTYRWEIMEQLQTQYNIPTHKIMVVPPGMVVA